MEENILYALSVISVVFFIFLLFYKAYQWLCVALPKEKKAEKRHEKLREEFNTTLKELRDDDIPDLPTKGDHLRAHGLEVLSRLRTHGHPPSEII